MPMIEEKRLIPNHQFGFRSKHTTIEYLQNYKITLAFEVEKYCSIVFLDVSQTFDKI